MQAPATAKETRCVLWRWLVATSLRGKILNVAFTVSAAFTFGDHLGFTAANMPGMIAAVIIGKLVGGFTALTLALLILPRLAYLTVEKESQERNKEFQ